MRPITDIAIEIIGCHAEGEVGDVIISGVEPPPGDTVWEQALWISNDGTLRNFVLNEPLGKNTVVIRPGKVDRSPTGTGLSARQQGSHPAINIR